MRRGYGHLSRPYQILDVLQNAHTAHVNNIVTMMMSAVGSWCADKRMNRNVGCSGLRYDQCLAFALKRQHTDSMEYSGMLQRHLRAVCARATATTMTSALESGFVTKKGCTKEYTVYREN